MDLSLHPCLSSALTMFLALPVLCALGSSSETPTPASPKQREHLVPLIPSTMSEYLHASSRRKLKALKPPEGEIPPPIENPVLPPKRRNRCSYCPESAGPDWCGANGLQFSSRCEAMCTFPQPYKRDGSCSSPRKTCGIMTADCFLKTGAAPLLASPGCKTCPYPRFSPKQAPFAKSAFPHANYPVCALLQAQCDAACYKLKQFYYYGIANNATSAASARLANDKWHKCTQACFGVDKVPCPNAVAVLFRVGESAFCMDAPSLFCGEYFTDSKGVRWAWSTPVFASLTKESA